MSLWSLAEAAVQGLRANNSQPLAALRAASAGQPIQLFREQGDWTSLLVQERGAERGCLVSLDERCYLVRPDGQVLGESSQAAAWDESEECFHSASCTSPQLTLSRAEPDPAAAGSMQEWDVPWLSAAAALLVPAQAVLQTAETFTPVSVAPPPPETVSEPTAAICSSCSAALPPGARFCGQCGRRQGLSACACGRLFQPGEKFCGQCGQPRPKETHS